MNFLFDGNRIYKSKYHFRISFQYNLFLNEDFFEK